MSLFKRKRDEKYSIGQFIHFRDGKFIAGGVVVEFRGKYMHVDIRASNVRSLVVGTAYWFEIESPQWTAEINSSWS